MAAGLCLGCYPYIYKWGNIFCVNHASWPMCDPMCTFSHPHACIQIETIMSMSTSMHALIASTYHQFMSPMHRTASTHSASAREPRLLFKLPALTAAAVSATCSRCPASPLRGQLVELLLLRPDRQLVLHQGDLPLCHITYQAPGGNAPQFAQPAPIQQLGGQATLDSQLQGQEQEGAQSQEEDDMDMASPAFPAAAHAAAGPATPARSSAPKVSVVGVRGGRMCAAWRDGLPDGTCQAFSRTALWLLMSLHARRMRAQDLYVKDVKQNGKAAKSTGRTQTPPAPHTTMGWGKNPELRPN